MSEVFLILNRFTCDNPWCSPEHPVEAYSSREEADEAFGAMKAASDEIVVRVLRSQDLMRSRLAPLLTAHGIPPHSVLSEGVEQAQARRGLEQILRERILAEVGLSDEAYQQGAYGPWPSRVLALELV